jgi:hypothetical protein
MQFTKSHSLSLPVTKVEMAERGGFEPPTLDRSNSLISKQIQRVRTKSAQRHTNRLTNFSPVKPRLVPNSHSLGKTSGTTQSSGSRHHQFSGGPAVNLNPAAMLNPIFNCRDALISDYGVYLYLVVVWLSLVVIARVLSGGLRRRRPQENSGTIISGIIITMRPPNQSPPPIVITEIHPVQNDDNKIIDEP